MFFRCFSGKRQKFFSKRFLQFNYNERSHTTKSWNGASLFSVLLAQVGLENNWITSYRYRGVQSRFPPPPPKKKGWIICIIKFLKSYFTGPNSKITISSINNISHWDSLAYYFRGYFAFSRQFLSLYTPNNVSYVSSNNLEII